MIELIVLAAAYFLGSIPTGYLVGLLANLDIREHGSGSTGAANVWRTVGKTAGIFVFAVDLIKGASAVWLMQSMDELATLAKPLNVSIALITSQPVHEGLIASAALLVILGHSYSCWLDFKGGKSAATGLGVLFALNWIVAFGAFGLWLATVALWRTTSIGSVFVAIAAPVLMVFTQSPAAYSLIACIGSILIIYRHRSNLNRLSQGTEVQISF
jgi:acyl phosphate:glycerol-3-phosphate acyltransferase